MYLRSELLKTMSINCDFPGCDAVHYSGLIPKFQGNVLPRSFKMKTVIIFPLNVSEFEQYHQTLHSAIPQGNTCKCVVYTRYVIFSTVLRWKSVEFFLYIRIHVCQFNITPDGVVTNLIHEIFKKVWSRMKILSAVRIG
jgi:hypothetical protein